MGINKDRDFGQDPETNPRKNGDYWKIAEERESKKCVFCDLKDKYVIKTSDHSTLTVNIFPYIDGQLIVIPNRHIIDISEAEPEEILDMQGLCVDGIKLLRENLGIDNVWLILRNGNVAGKTVKHLHWNILPYVEGLNTWNYKEITMQPIDVAKILRREDE